MNKLIILPETLKWIKHQESIRYVSMKKPIKHFSCILLPFCDKLEKERSVTVDRSSFYSSNDWKLIKQLVHLLCISGNNINTKISTNKSPHSSFTYTFN